MDENFNRAMMAMALGKAAREARPNLEALFKTLEEKPKNKQHGPQKPAFAKHGGRGRVTQKMR